MKCNYCPSNSFRRSRLRSGDYIKMLLLEFPVRCLRCRQRQQVPFLVGALSLSSETRHSSRKAISPQESWTAWTTGSNPGNNVENSQSSGEKHHNAS